MMCVATICVATGCGDDEEDNYADVWKTANDAAFNAIKTNSEYHELKSTGNEGSIYYKVITKGNGTKPIYYTSTVSCYYKGLFVADYPKYDIKNGDAYITQKLFDNGSPITISVSSISSLLGNGCKVALQSMVEGDKWEIWMPYQLGFGASDYQNSTYGISVPAYSTIVCEIEITKLIE